MIDLSLFRFSHPIEIRYADLDVLAHVNNAKYFTYMETTRLRYLNEVLGWGGLRSEQGVIIARAVCDYKLALKYGDAVRVHMRVARLGGKSFDCEYIVMRENDDAVAAVGSSVQVAYNYRADSSIPLPDEWRARILAFEPGLKQ